MDMVGWGAKDISLTGWEVLLNSDDARYSGRLWWAWKLHDALEIWWCWGRCFSNDVGKRPIKMKAQSGTWRLKLKVFGLFFWQKKLKQIITWKLQNERHNDIRVELFHDFFLYSTLILSLDFLKQKVKDMKIT